MCVEVGEGVVEVDVEIVPREASVDVEPPGDRRGKHDPVVWVHVSVGVGGSEQHLSVVAESGPVEDLRGGGDDLLWTDFGGFGQVGEPVVGMLGCHELPLFRARASQVWFLRVVDLFLWKT